MTYKTQLRRGKIVEKEHLAFYHKLKNQNEKSGNCVSDEKFTEGIAKAHIQEKSDYYDRLQKAGL